MALNYEDPVDTESLTKHVITTLKWGDPDVIPAPWITVLIPTYKRQDLLEEAINSVLSQAPTDFYWDIVVLDNEADDGKTNDTEKLIRKIDNKRILYYRNSENIRPGDNFNRGLKIARGEWICFLHDDDLLIFSALQRMASLIRKTEKIKGKELGAISARYHQFVYDPKRHITYADILGLNHFYSNVLPLDYGLYEITHANIWFTANIGGDVPSNGTTFRRKAALECGGFIDDFGISGDLILFYRMEKKYRVYSTSQPFGFYRWGNNTMSNPESTRRVIKDSYSFRKYVYSKNLLSKIGSLLFCRSHYFIFGKEVIEAKNCGLAREKWIKSEDFLTDGIKKPSHIQLLFFFIMRKLYFKAKGKQCNELRKRIQRMAASEAISE